MKTKLSQWIEENVALVLTIGVVIIFGMLFALNIMGYID